ncbi:MAG TPA: M67 family metallopeptidase, partial [Rhizomicrobium sp.]|nr:M67 family metallopeptidase [Rhizomicrobium sp.]
MKAFAIDAALCAQIAAEARAAYPRECCGLIEGMREGATVRATALHPTANLADAPDRFEIDPREQFRLMREGRTLVGCYHSHPDGRAEPSARDAEYAFDGDFVWLISGAKDRLAA